MAARTNGKRWRGRWLVGSLLVHALLVALASRRSVSDSIAPSGATPAQQLEIDVVPDDAEARAPSAGADAEPSRAAVALRAGSSPHAPALAAPATDAEPAAGAADEGEPGDAVAPPAPASATAAPHLSLSQLGVDGANPFVDRAADPQATQKARAARVKERLDRSFAQAALSADTAAGRGSASPVLRALEGAVYASTVALTSQATFSFVIDGSGKLLSSTLGDAQGDRAAWLRVAREAARALAGRTLSVPRGKSVKLTVAVTTRLELPSGADPGVEVDVFGIPVKKGGGKRSTRVDLLNPLNPLAPLSLLGDPADIGARARRMVNAHLVSEELL